MFGSWGPSDWAAFFIESAIVWPTAGYLGWKLGKRLRG